MNNFWSSKRGTSLVEVLVCMVVLLVGIMTVVQMFPSGFGVVRASESQTIATRLAQQELERWKSLAANLPDGILPIDDETLSVINEAFPGPPFVDFVKDSNGDYRKVGTRAVRGNLLNTRQVFGETTSIPTASTFTTGSGSNYGSRYTLAFSPVDVIVDPATGDLDMQIRSGDLARRTANSEYPPPYLRPGMYAIDYELADGKEYAGQQVFHVAFPRDASVSERKYYISYSVRAFNPDQGGDPEIVSVPSQLVCHAGGSTTIAGTDNDWIEVPIDSASLPEGYEISDIERYTDTCARGFIENNTGTWGSSPYEYYLADSVLGVIAFNPAGHNKYEYTARGVQPIKARIDYKINDSRILREDRVVPAPVGSASTISIRLSLPFILNVGDPTDNPDEETYQGLVRDRNGNVLYPGSVLVMDLSNGLRVDPSAVSIDYKAGVITLPETANLYNYTDPDPAVSDVSLVGRHLRFFYRADGDWSIGCSKAYVSYIRKYSGEADYRSFRLLSYTSNRLLFAPCELGKAVVVDYTYVDPDGVEHKVTGEEHRIDVDRDASYDRCFIDLNLPDDCYLPRGGRITVTGSSFAVRVSWRDGKRWRYVNMDTSLTRS